MVIYDHRTHRIIGSTKTRPAWATEEKLKHLIFMPALSQMAIVLEFYAHGRSTIEIARETGLSKFAIRTLLVRVRRALGIKRERRGETLRLAPKKQAHAKHDQFADGFGKRAALWGSRGRHFHPVIRENELRDLFLKPALERFEIARLYWLKGLTSEQVATRLGLQKKSVEYQLARIRRLASNPKLRQHVSRAVTKAGKKRSGVAAPYTRRQLKHTL